MILTKPKPTKREPEPGDYRVDIRFAWWPVRTDKGLIWLERYKRIYEWTIHPRSWFIGRYYLGPVICGGWELKQTKRLKSNQ